MRVVIAEDSVLLREGITRLLAEHDAEVVAALGDAGRLLAAVRETRPDLVIVDVRMPPTFTDEGLRAAVELRAVLPGTPVLVLSQYVEERFATELLGGSTVGGRLPCSRSASPTSATSSARAGASRSAAPPSTPTSSPSCWCAAAGASRSPASRRASATCSV